MSTRYFRDKSVLLTGGSSGIGLAAARILRSGGAHLTLVARNEERLKAARDELADMGGGTGDLHIVPLDVGDGDAVRSALADLPGGRPVDVLINNAGITRPGHFLELPQSVFDNMMRVNYMGAVHATRAILPSMVERGRGDISFVSSLVGLIGVFGYTAYSASKFAVRGFAESLRCEVKPKGVRVSVCYPSDTDTPQHEYEQEYLPDETRAIAGNAKVTSAEEVATRLLKGIETGTFHILPGGGTWFADFMYRMVPGIVRMAFDSDVRTAQEKAQKG